MSYLKVEFPGGLRVDARLNNQQVIKTDQPISAGGEGSAPSPFQVFLGSIATCAGIYALGFCNSKGISTEGMSIDMEVKASQYTNLISDIELVLRLPKDFPGKYRSAIIKSMELCAVKKHLQEPPKFHITTSM